MKSDRPVADPDSDRFQRYPFAKQIAQTILTHKHADSLTIGLYGKWGEGKTSVIELVIGELKLKAIPVRFNPWQFSSEQVLLMAFFEMIANAVSVELHSEAVKLADTFRAYSGLITIGKLIPKEAVEAVTNALPKASLSSHHKTISNALNQVESPIVVFIDDIDRLESTEIQAVFRLVKVVADFPNVIYVLAFDPDRVVDALKGTFGDGQAYLEKIIQVPLTLPKAQPAALRRYTYDLIGQAIQESGIVITEEELNFFRKTFEKYLADYITTPRDPTRISNAIRFSLPMLNREANMGDLMLLEVIKVLHPTLYQNIRKSPLTYTTAYNSYTYSYNHKRAEEQKTKALENINNHLSYLPQSERQNIQELLQKLFPPLDTLFRNIGYGSDEPFKRWHQQKRLCSSHYFNRYFTYAVIEGEIPDAQFEEFLLLLETQPLQASIIFFDKEFRQTDSFDFVLKLRFHEGKLTSRQGEAMARLLCHFGSKFFAYDKYQTAYAAIDLISKYIAQQPKENQAKFSRELVESIIPLSSALPFQHELRQINRRDDPDALLSAEVMSVIEETLFHRLLTEVEHSKLFTAFDPSDLRILFQSWTKYNQPILALRECVNQLLEIEPVFSLHLLKVLSPTYFDNRSSNSERINHALSEHDFAILEAIADLDKLYTSVLEQYGAQSYSSVNEEDDYAKMTDMDLIGQFQQWYNARKNNLEQGVN